MRWYERLQPEGETAKSEIIVRPMCATCHHWAPRDDYPRVPVRSISARGACA